MEYQQRRDRPRYRNEERYHHREDLVDPAERHHRRRAPAAAAPVHYGEEERLTPRRSENRHRGREQRSPSSGLRRTRVQHEDPYSHSRRSDTGSVVNTTPSRPSLALIGGGRNDDAGTGNINDLKATLTVLLRVQAAAMDLLEETKVRAAEKKRQRLLRDGASSRGGSPGGAYPISSRDGSAEPRREAPQRTPQHLEVPQQRWERPRESRDEDAALPLRPRSPSTPEKEAARDAAMRQLAEQHASIQNELSQQRRSSASTGGRRGSSPNHSREPSTDPVNRREAPPHGRGRDDPGLHPGNEDMTTTYRQTFESESTPSDAQMQSRHASSSRAMLRPSQSHGTSSVSHRNPTPSPDAVTVEEVSQPTPSVSGSSHPSSKPRQRSHHGERGQSWDIDVGDPSRSPRQTGPSVTDPKPQAASQKSTSLRDATGAGREQSHASWQTVPSAPPSHSRDTSPNAKPPGRGVTTTCHSSSEQRQRLQERQHIERLRRAHQIQQGQPVASPTEGNGGVTLLSTTLYPESHPQAI